MRICRRRSGDSQFAGSTAENAKCSLGKALLSGAVGGLVGTIVMTQFQNAWSKAAEEIERKKRGEQTSRSSREDSAKDSEDATMKAAGKIASLAGRELSHETKKKLGPVVHYSFGTIQGAVYGTVVEAAGAGGGLIAGLVFGAALFAAADELAVPALGLAGKPGESPLTSHLYALASHLVYGLSSEVARRGLRASV